MALGLGLGLQFRRNNVGGFTGLFDQFGYPAFGASMRLLGRNYTGGLVRVRAFDGLADQGTADVMPYKIGNEFWVDLNSTLDNLDATAIGRGLTTSDTLGDLLSSGVNDYDGFVTTWFDQSGNANDAGQGAAADQPQIASAGSLITENGKPCVQQISNGRLELTSIFNLTTSFSVAKVNSISSVNYLYGSDSVTTGVLLQGTVSGVNGLSTFDGSNIRTLNNAETTNQELQFVYNDGNANLAINGNSPVNAGTCGTITVEYILGRRIADPLNGCAQEIIFYPTDKTTDKTPIETNINNAFSIYP